MWWPGMGITRKFHTTPEYSGAYFISGKWIPSTYVFRSTLTIFKWWEWTRLNILYLTCKIIKNMFFFWLSWKNGQLTFTSAANVSRVLRVHRIWFDEGVSWDSRQKEHLYYYNSRCTLWLFTFTHFGCKLTITNHNSLSLKFIKTNYFNGNGTVWIVRYIR